VTRQLVDDLLKYKRLEGVGSALAPVRQALRRRPSRVLADALPASQAGAGDLGRGRPHHPGRPRPALSGRSRWKCWQRGHMVQMEAANDVNRAIARFVG
jgi:pyruvate dehydrogenase E2 component (dihydrolipoamide acetyltransferase)